jgi:phosphate transport system permease protein
MVNANVLRQRPGVTALKDRLAGIAVWTAAALIFGLLAWILADVLIRGVSQLSLEFVLGTPDNSGRSGGIVTIIVSTSLLLAVTLITAVPVSLATAIGLAEYTRDSTWSGTVVRRSLDVLAAVPSIVFGLFGNALFCIALGMGYSVLAGGLTLACMILPVLIRTSEQALRAVPNEYRLGAAGLGIRRVTTLLKIELPMAASAIGAGLVLGIGRALAETAALILTSGYVTRMPESLLDSGRSLSVHIYELTMNVPGGNPRAYATAAVLITLILIINAVAMMLSRLASGGSGQNARGGIVL